MSSRFTMRDPTRFKLWIVYFRQKNTGWIYVSMTTISQSHPLYGHLWTIKWPTCPFQGSYLDPLYRGIGGIKWPVQHRFCFFRGFTWSHFIEAFSVGGGGIKWPVQHRFCFTIDSVNDFDIDICLAVGFVRFRSHSKSFGLPIDEIDDIPPKFERGPSTL